MTHKAREAIWYSVAMGILVFGGVAIIGHGTDGKDVVALTVWALAYGGTMAGSAYHRGRRDAKGRIR